MTATVSLAPTPSAAAQAAAAATESPSRLADTDAGSVFGAGPQGTATAPTTPTIREFRLSEVAPRPLSTLSTTAAPVNPSVDASDDATRLVAVSSPRPVSGYGVVGATWQGPWPTGLRFAVRTRVGQDDWSGWQTLHGGDCPCAACVASRSIATVSGHGPDADTAEFRDARPGTDAMAVGDVDQVQLRVTSPGGVLPDDLTLAVVDPGRTITAPTSEPRAASPSRGGLSASRATTATAASASSVPARPTILSRARWGADERMRTGNPSYGTIRAGFVHHTVNANGYTRKQVPEIIRGIYAYHTQSKGWSDIGYNFLVDRFGRIWEGRYGGVARPVIGAHTYGYNHLSFAMSAIGNFDAARPSTEMLNAYGRLYAWKLGRHGIRANSTQNLAGRSYPAISGHRDVGQTACPGRYLYAKLPAIRRRAARIQSGGTVTEPAAPVYQRGPDVVRDLDGDGLADLLVRDRDSGRLQVLRGDRGPGFLRPRTTPIRPGRMDLVTGVGDVTRDGYPDLLTRVRRAGITQLRPGRPDRLYGRRVVAADTRRFAGADLLAGAGDLVGNRRPDVLARDSRTHRLWVYPGRAEGRWGARRLLLERAARLRTVAGAGDLDGDGHLDLLATSRRRLLLYPGTGHGELGSRVVLSRQWSGRDLTVAGHDLTGDDVPDLLARDRASGRTWIYAMEEGGRPGPRFGGWRSWAGLSGLTAVGDPGTGATRLIARTRNEELVVLDSRDRGWLTAPTATGRRAADLGFAQPAGDWDGDGHVDVIARLAETGNVVLYPGTGDGRLGVRRRLWTGWTDRRSLVVSADLTGDENPDLLARDPGGAIYVYPSDGSGGKQKRRLARQHLFPTDLITSVGYWNDDNVRDLVVRRTRSKELYLVPGTTSGGLGRPVSLKGGFAAYNRIVGVGDLDGDDHPDLVARESATGRLWLFPGRPEGLGAAEYLAPRLGRFNPLG